MDEVQSSGAIADGLRIERGLCYVMFAYDAARAIDLEKAEKRIHATSERQTIRHKRRTPNYFEYQPPPLRVSYGGTAVQIEACQARPNVDLILYDFGAVAALYSLPIVGSFDELLRLSEELYDNSFLLSDSRKRVEELLKVLGDAATHANLATVVEDYVIFHVESLSRSLNPSEFLASHCRQIAQILRAESRPLSDQEVDDALSARLSYGMEDLAVIDWNAALLIDRDGDDVREVLQFANVELLEMRYLDQRLDGALDSSYVALSPRSAGSSRPKKLGRYGSRLRAVAELQVDNATLFEGVNNALKLLGDQYLARIYRLVSRRFHLDDWDASILRKLQTLESIYQKMSDQAATRRMEVLEWIIILLFVVSIVLELIHFGSK
jgi:hypothetical protein